MRRLMWATLAAGLAIGACGACAQSLNNGQRGPAAVSAERYGSRANYVDARAGHGYSAQARHMTDCLATYPSYDPRTDQVTIRPGVTRRCDL
jgi:hypothetical protein